MKNSLRVMAAVLCSLPLTLQVACSSDSSGGTEDDLTSEKLLKGISPSGSMADYTYSITVDDGPNDGRCASGSGGDSCWSNVASGSGHNTQKIAEYLASEGIPGTFFFLGSRVKATSASLMTTVRDMRVAGTSTRHLIASHTYNHVHITDLSASEQRDAVLKTDDLLQPYYDRGIALMRTPYGAWDASVSRNLNQSSRMDGIVGNVHWDIGGDGAPDKGLLADWYCWNNGVSVETCADAYVNEAISRKRGIILSHDISRKSYEMLKLVVQGIRSRSGGRARFVRVDEVPMVKAALLARGGGGGSPGPSSDGTAKAGATCAPGCIFSASCVSKNASAKRYTAADGSSLVCVQSGSCTTECSATNVSSPPAPPASEVKPGATCAPGCIYSANCVSKNASAARYTASDGSKVVCVQSGNCSSECTVSR